MYCGNCGHQMKEGDKFCTNCGFDSKPKEKKEEKIEELKEEKKEEKVVEVKPVNDNKPVVNNSIQNNNTSQTPTIGIVAIIFSLLFWPIGLVLGIIAIVKGKELKNNRTLGIIATVISSIGFLISIIVFSIILAIIPSVVREIEEEGHSTIDEIYEKEDEAEKSVQGKWTCTTSSGNSIIITFRLNNDFEALHNNDKIEGNYYAYENYTNKNSYNIYLYYDEDEKAKSGKLEFMKQTDNKAIMTVEDQIFNCLK